MTDISILLPIMNEVENISTLLMQIEEVFNKELYSYEVVAVDDGSTDGTSQLLIDLAKVKPYLRVIAFRRNFGQTAAFDAGFHHASGTIIVTMDADLQNDPKDIIPMIKMLESGYDFVTGWRKDRNDTLFLRKIPSWIANRIIRFVTKTKLNDMGCSLKVYKKEIVTDLKLYGEMHRFISVLVEGMGAKVGEYVVNHRPRIMGTSKYGIRRTFKVILDLLTVWFLQQYRTKPLHVFGGVGLVLLSLAGIFLGITLWDKISIGVWVHKNPFFTLSAVFSIIGIQFLGLGLIAELVIRTYYESQNKRTYSILGKFGFGDSENFDKRSQKRPSSFQVETTEKCAE